MSDEQEKTFSKRDVDSLVTRGNIIMKKYHVIQALNQMGIREDRTSRGFEGVAEIAAALALVDMKLREKDEKAIEAAGDDIKWF